ncbi:MAG TPA: iron-sulfur cluster-binding domain-containing protein [Oscillospiraceae bacterium]|nr:iron-sulfur cluster-binding domain-containing protein [Oscillospiraceae bacterium]HPS35741.1 iron-sulfur cluster-binding domain-containing protein [Oscillospiraceae bacterium]
MSNFNFHVKPIGLFDMLHFKKMVPARQKALACGSTTSVTGVYGSNKLAGILHPKTQCLTISEIIEHGENAKSYVLTGEHPAPFRAGQYLSVSLKIGSSVLTRPYSISCSPKWASESKYALTVKRQQDGFASGWILDNWRVGDEITTSGPEGTFYYEPLRDAKHVVGLAGGCGITPFLSMAYAIRDGVEDFRLTLLYGSRKEADILYRRELDEIAKATDKVRIVHILSDEKKEGFEYGFITAEEIQKACEGDTCSLFLCGPAAMYAFVDKEIEKLNLTGKFIRHELYAAAASPGKFKDYPGDTGKAFTLTVKLYGETLTMPMASSETVLVALERAGVAAPSRCRGGECGWCRAKLDSGEVFLPAFLDKRRMADVRAGYIHPCCSYPLGDLAIEVWPE